MKALLKDKSAEIVDARAADRFAGQGAGAAPGLRSGHIPGAHNLPFAKLLNKDGTLKTAPEIERLFEEAGVDLTQARGGELRLRHHGERACARACRDRASPGCCL